MDTFVHITIMDKLAEKKGREIMDKVVFKMQQLEKRLNYFSTDLEPSDDLDCILAKGEEIKRLTDGAFDVSINGKLDLGGIAKGYIVDAGIEILKENGIANALINAGGDMYCMGEGSGEGWNVGIRDPNDTTKIITMFKVRDRGVATSGDYERPGHIRDPVSGERLARKGKSVTIVARDAMTADALATAAYVLSAERIVTILGSMDGVAYFITYEDGNKAISENFPQITLTKKEP